MSFPTATRVVATLNGSSKVASSSRTTLQGLAGLQRQGHRQPQQQSRRNFSYTHTHRQAPIPAATMPSSQASTGNPIPKDQLSQLRQYPNHPLLQFFQTVPTEVPRDMIKDPHFQLPRNARPYDPRAKDTDRMLVDLPASVSVEDLGRDNTSRSWLASELRTKSSADLHTLWYVLLMERNRLATTWEELGRVGARQASKIWSQNLSYKNHRVRKSMARIKLVLNERRLALIEAQQQVRSVGDESVELQAQEPTSNLFEDPSLLQEQDVVRSVNKV
ncbi:hypothetical protein IE53DRAFT_384242 [Violaceomyces palustris]|uniref:Uncharacterized protein n=1 Tax=Violaceomyces palustris TaxID=1673888 RepID=A0ACD0P5C8_9BASI|nr:hypothetical protein IE53DRAFT_384242 [Violaceomyces palustris]